MLQRRHRSERAYAGGKREGHPHRDHECPSCWTLSLPRFGQPGEQRGKAIRPRGSSQSRTRTPQFAHHAWELSKKKPRTETGPIRSTHGQDHHRVLRALCRCHLNPPHSRRLPAERLRNSLKGRVCHLASSQARNRPHVKGASLLSLHVTFAAVLRRSFSKRPSEVPFALFQHDGSFLLCPASVLAHFLRGN
jgi:hypothetical protein